MKSRYTLLVFLLVLPFLKVLAQNSDTPSIYTFVEQMPEPGYNWNKYLAENLRYPDFARKHNIQGRVLIKFVINEDGRLSDASIIHGIGGGCDEEVYRIVKSAPAWKPGRQNGENVKVFFTLPITFKLKDDDENTVSVTTAHSDSAIEIKPGQPTPGYNFNNYLAQNLKYPFNARRKHIEGKVMIAFTVGIDGSISDCRVEKGIGGGCDEEALRVIKNMPRWRPDEEQPTKCTIVLPIEFKLPKTFKD